MYPGARASPPYTCLYVCAHAYIPKAIIRAINNGVRTIEHGNLLDDNAAKVMAKNAAYLVPTNVTYQALYKHGKEFGFPEASMEKLEDVLEVGLRAVEIAKNNAGYFDVIQYSGFSLSLIHI